jgi:hypothetical protein
MAYLETAHVDIGRNRVAAISGQTKCVTQASYGLEH